MKRIASLRQMSNDQLKNRLNDIGPALSRAVQFNKAGKGEKDTMRIRNLKDERARIYTILGERESKK
jgi:ribosomal protein L29